MQAAKTSCPNLLQFRPPSHTPVFSLHNERLHLHGAAALLPTSFPCSVEIPASLKAAGRSRHAISLDSASGCAAPSSSDASFPKTTPWLLRRSGTIEYPRILLTACSLSWCAPYRPSSCSRDAREPLLSVHWAPTLQTQRSRALQLPTHTPHRNRLDNLVVLNPILTPLSAKTRMFHTPSVLIVSQRRPHNTSEQEQLTQKASPDPIPTPC